MQAKYVQVRPERQCLPSKLEAQAQPPLSVRLPDGRVVHGIELVLAIVVVVLEIGAPVVGRRLERGKRDGGGSTRKQDVVVEQIASLEEQRQRSAIHVELFSA